ncbi:hypothetical protein DAPPUDRAFT_244863 [Daphnia pulex]|uniref:Uncharacterized protein n=1 Tax=Daphnia pulex TaxID=6669 RepID=E9GM11_DAPPU|nr:hypothetical protein DAPPUDRAFT_244863 [Daphnia pulex]|eukprot:EFX79284.1 hypothetical protein DAPPUDRAFT_244863 [Daphnia pulex]
MATKAGNMGMDGKNDQEVALFHPTHPQQLHPAEGKASLHFLQSKVTEIIRSQSRIITPQLVLLPELHYQSAEYYTEAPKYYTTKAPTETTQLRMLPQPTTPRLQLITPLKLSNTTLERPSTIEVSRVSFSNTQHSSPEVSNNLRFKQWNDQDKDNGGVAFVCVHRVVKLDIVGRKAELDDGRAINLRQVPYCHSGAIKDVHEHVTLFRNIDAGSIGRVLPKCLSQWTSEKVKAQGVNVLPKANVEGAILEDCKVALTLNDGQKI